MEVLQTVGAICGIIALLALSFVVLLWLKAPRG